VDAQPLADAVADRRARVQAGIRVLEDDLDPATVGLERRTLDRRGPQRSAARPKSEQRKETPEQRRRRKKQRPGKLERKAKKRR